MSSGPVIARVWRRVINWVSSRRMITNSWTGDCTLNVVSWPSQFRRSEGLIMMKKPAHILSSACLAILAVCTVGPNAQAQTPAQTSAEPAKSVFDRYTETIQLYKTGLGTFTKPMSSTNKEAQAFFDQGFQMMYAFAKPEAVRSFRESWKRDPECAICYWGEAWAWGSYLNSPMNEEESPNAYAAIQKAATLESHATAKERALIESM